MAHGKRLPSRMQVCGLLACYRKEAGLSQTEAAELLGVSQPALSRVEAGKQWPSVPLLRDMSVVYEIKYKRLGMLIAKVSM